MSQKHLIAIALLATFLCACGTGAEESAVRSIQARETSAAASPPQAVSYAKDVAPIFAASCNSCHGEEKIKAGLDMTSYEQLMRGSSDGAVIVPGDAEASLLTEMIVNGKMPKRGDKLTDAQIQIILNWINAGAPNN